VFALVLAPAVVLVLTASALAQWQPLPPPQGPATPPAQYPPQPYPQQQQQYPPQYSPQYPPAQSPYPPQSQYPPQQPVPPQQQQVPPQQQAPQIQPGQGFGDVLGRFRATLPAGTAPSSVTYQFMVPTAGAFLNIMSVPQDQMFQMQMQNFAGMMQQMGGKIETNHQTDLRGKPGQFVHVIMRDQQSGQSMHSMNVFVQGPNVWFQVMGPDQSAQQLVEIMNMLLKSAQFQ
jgi:hypothetical protein